MTRSAFVFALLMASSCLIGASEPLPRGEDEEKTTCDQAVAQLVTELRPHASTPELYYNPPVAQRSRPSELPQGARPVGPLATMRSEQRGNLAERRAEACYQFAVEIARHNGISLDGKESYDRLRELQTQFDRETRQRAFAISLPAACLVPGTDQSVPEGSARCLVFKDVSLCPSCKSGFRHKCTRIEGSNDAAWAKGSLCLASERLAAEHASDSGGLYSRQAEAVIAGGQEDLRRQRRANALENQPRPELYVRPADIYGGNLPVPNNAADSAGAAPDPSRPHRRCPPVGRCAPTSKVACECAEKDMIVW